MTGIDGKIFPLIGHLGIEERANELLWKYNNHTARNYQIRLCEHNILISNGREVIEIKKYIQLTDYGRLELQKLRGK